MNLEMSNLEALAQHYYRPSEKGWLLLLA